MYHVGIDERHEHESPANSRYDGVRTLSVLDVTRKRRTKSRRRGERGVGP